MSSAPRREQTAGITLIELMIVAVIIGVLGAVALPSYRKHVVRAHRTEAKSALLQLATNQERFYLQHRRYGTIAELAAAGFPVASENNVYRLAVATAAGWAQDYTATATAAPGGGSNGVDMTSDLECASFTLDSRGVRGASGERCW
jgi:type IV pilus assembly protein PilE